MKQYKVQLTFQCSEDWNKMNSNRANSQWLFEPASVKAGRHCLSCNKTVIDFSTMKDDEIVQYLLKNKNTCGRFYKNQLNRPMVLLKSSRRVNWPAIAAMLIAGLVSVVPNNINANPVNQTNIVYSHVKKVEPDKTGKYSFTIRLLKTNTDQKIYYGSVYIENIGTFYDNGTGSIVIEMDKDAIPAKVWVEVSAYGYEAKQFSLNTKDLKTATNADIFLNEMEIQQEQRYAGTVSIQENEIPKK